jgi:dTDP-4-dehydrorhamnose reductase
MKKTILIFGASSFIGSNLIEALKNDFRIIATYYKTQLSIPGVTCIACDVTKKEQCNALVTRFKPDFTIYAGGLSSISDCQKYPKLAELLNSAGAINCCAAAERTDSKFIFFSSCFVLGGLDLETRENETPFPNTVYGSSLSSTEFYVQRSCLNYMIFRCSPLYGRGFGPLRKNWFEHLQLSLAKGEAFPCDGSVVTGFLDVQVMIQILKMAIERNVTNRLFHLSSRDSMTRYEFARTYAKVFHKDEGSIQRVTSEFPLKDGPTTQGKLSYKLDCSNIEQFMGLTLPSVEESLQITYQRMKTKTSA